MSARDAEALLNTPKLFIFLPVVNYVYLIGTTDTNHAIVMCSLAVFSSAFIYNTLDGIPSDRATEVRVGLTLLFLVAGIVWLYLLYRSAESLLDAFHLTSVVHEALFFITLSFVAIVLTHLLLLLTVQEYQNEV